jgi:MFS family permease
MFIATFVIYGLLRHAGNAPPVNVDLRQRLRTMLQGTHVAFRGTRLWAIFAVAAVRGMADGSMLFLVPLYLTQALGINTFQAAAHLALMVGPAMVTAPLLGALSDRVGRKPLIVFLMAFATTLTLAIPLGGQQYSVWITVCVALYGLQHFTVINLTSAAAADVAARYRLESSFLGLMWGNNTLFGALGGGRRSGCGLGTGYRAGQLALDSGLWRADYVHCHVCHLRIAASCRQRTTGER